MSQVKAGVNEDQPCAQVLEALGAQARARGDYEEAVGLLREALRCAGRSEGRDSRPVVGLLNELGIACKYSGRFDEGRGYYERALAILTAGPSLSALDLAAIYHNLGGLEHARADYVAAEPYARAAVTTRELALGPEHIEVAADKAAHAAILDGLGGHDQAAAMLREAIDTFERALGPAHREVAVSLNNLAAILERSGQLDEAERLYQRALAIKERTLGPDHPETAFTLNNLAVNYRRNGRYEAAERTFRRALEIFEDRLAPSHPAIRTCARNYARLRRAAHHDEACVTRSMSDGTARGDSASAPRS